jgi:hypothetical protein
VSLLLGFGSQSPLTVALLRLTTCILLSGSTRHISVGCHMFGLAMACMPSKYTCCAFRSCVLEERRQSLQWPPGKAPSTSGAAYSSGHSSTVFTCVNASHHWLTPSAVQHMHCKVALRGSVTAVALSVRPQRGIRVTAINMCCEALLQRSSAAAAQGVVDPRNAWACAPVKKLAVLEKACVQRTGSSCVTCAHILDEHNGCSTEQAHVEDEQ